MEKFLCILSVLALITVSASAKKAPKIKTVKVATATEFLDAIASNRMIILTEDYYDITGALLQPEYASLGLDYDTAKNTNKNVFWVDNFDGPELHIANVQNLTIVAEQDVVMFVIEPRYSDVITFERCSGIKLQGITFGHTDEGYCDRGVLGFYNCSNCEVERCDLFGCGTEGIVVSRCEHMTFTATKIRDCSYHIMHVMSSSHVLFNGCQFFRNREFEQVNIFSCYDVVFDNCVFANNTGTLFNLDSNTIILRDSVILHDDMFIGDIDSVQFINSINEEYFHPEQAFG